MKKKGTKFIGEKGLGDTTKSSRSRKAYPSTPYQQQIDYLLEVSIEDIKIMETLNLLPGHTLCQLRGAGMASVLFVLKDSRNGSSDHWGQLSKKLKNVKSLDSKKSSMTPLPSRQETGFVVSASGHLAMSH